MKKLFQLLMLAVVASSLSSCGYNAMVGKREDAKSKWANVESAYQRRADLIPGLVSTVQGAADFEQGTLTAVIEARASATQIKLDANDLSEENIQKFQAAQDKLSGSLSRLLVSVEKYPELKAVQGFSDLMSSLEGTENRINNERNVFNDAVKDYNTYIASFPEVLYAGYFGFKAMGYFKAAEGSDKAPPVQFDFKKK